MQLNDKIALKKLRQLIDEALIDVAKQLNLTDLKTGNISYDASGCEAKIQVIAKSARADGKTKEELDYAQYAEMYGLKPEWLHQVFRHGRGHDAVEIMGLLPSRSKFPVLVQDTATKKRFLITIEEVQRKFDKAAHEASNLELVPAPPRTS